MKESIPKVKRPKPLKADLHLHTADDPLDRIRHTAKELISKAADENFDVISITNHQQMTFNHDLRSYAQERGILLIPGVEMTIQRRHVLVLNPPSNRMCSDFLSLSKLRRPETLIVAPHPYFPGTYSLNGCLLKHQALFDALEYCHFYSSMINFNQRALEVCQSFGFPLIGNSDAHFLFQMGTTYSLIYAAKNLDSIFAAIRGNRVEVVTRPLRPSEIGSIVNRFLRMKLRGKIGKRPPRPHSQFRKSIPLPFQRHQLTGQTGSSVEMRHKNGPDLPIT
jgi:predicted metal-dependent phosphoesterase TrpH